MSWKIDLLVAVGTVAIVAVVVIGYLVRLSLENRAAELLEGDPDMRARSWETFGGEIAHRVFGGNATDSDKCGRSLPTRGSSTESSALT
jgi:hypothetical protein